jgi:hypothetical protein
MVAGATISSCGFCKLSHDLAHPEISDSGKIAALSALTL